MNWRPFPFLRLLVPLVFGILIAEFGLPNNGPGFLICAAAIFLAAVLAAAELPFSKKSWPGRALVFAAFLLGWQAVFIQNELRADDHFSKKAKPKTEAFFLARVADEPARTARKWKIRLAIEAVGPSADSLESCSGNLLTYFDTTILASSWGIGDRVLFGSKIEKPPTAAVRGDFDFRKYLHTQHIHYQAFTEPEAVFFVSKNEKPSLKKWAIDSRRRCLEILKKHLSDGDEFAVASGIVVGYRADLGDEIRSAYLETGAMHALAVSGMHVAGIWWLLGRFFGLFPRGSRVRRIAEPTISILVIWAFALVTGAAPSIMRAAVMFSFFLLGKALRRESEGINSLAASAFLLLLFDPMWLFDVGFQLSYLAVAGIILFQKPLEKLATMPSDFLQKGWQITTAGLAAQVAVLPVSLFYFHQFPLYFWLSGLVVVPLGLPALTLGFLVIFLDPIWPFAAFWLGKGLFWLIKLQNESLFLIQKLPGAVAENVWASGAGCVALYFLIGALAVWWLQKKPRYLVAAAASGLAFSMIFCFEKLRILDERQIRLGLFPRKSEMHFAAGGAVFSTVAAGLLPTEKSEKAEPPPAGFPLADERPVLRFVDQKIAVIADEKSLGGPAADVDFVWLAGSPRLKMEQVFEQFRFKKALFDLSVPRYRAKIWAEECRAMGLDFHDVRADGPFVFDF